MNTKFSNEHVVKVWTNEHQSMKSLSWPQIQTLATIAKSNYRATAVVWETETGGLEKFQATVDICEFARRCPNLVWEDDQHGQDSRERSILHNGSKHAAFENLKLHFSGKDTRSARCQQPVSAVGPESDVKIPGAQHRNTSSSNREVEFGGGRWQYDWRSECDVSKQNIHTVVHKQCLQRCNTLNPD